MHRIAACDAVVVHARILGVVQHDGHEVLARVQARVDRVDGALLAGDDGLCGLLYALARAHRVLVGVAKRLVRVKQDLQHAAIALGHIPDVAVQVLGEVLVG